MARYLIRLGRETGHGRHWNRALAMLDTVISRLLPLGLSMRTAPRSSDQAVRFVSGTNSGVWGLHSMLMETVLDFAGLEYEALDRRLTLDPAPAQRLAAHRLDAGLPLRRGRLPPRTADRWDRPSSSVFEPG